MLCYRGKFLSKLSRDLEKIINLFEQLNFVLYSIYQRNEVLRNAILTTSAKV